MAADYLFLPSLRTLKIQHGYFMDKRPYFSAGKHRSTAVTDLQLFGCYDHHMSNSVEEVILSSSHRQRLVFERNTACQHHDPWRRLNVMGIALAICEYRDSLEELIVALIAMLQNATAQSFLLPTWLVSEPSNDWRFPSHSFRRPQTNT